MLTAIWSLMTIASWALVIKTGLAVPVAIGVSVIAVYLMLCDWMHSPRGHEATVALRLGIQIGKLRRRG